ncbi:MAG: adenosylmethionine decarboxylase [bacterium]|nr:adenosylmethionine decarboxylase [bacterium]
MNQSFSATPSARSLAGGVGTHIIADFWGASVPENTKELKAILWEAAEQAGGTPLKFSAHRFRPFGITAVLILSESHIAIHTWPELSYAAVDAFTCGKAKPRKAISYLKKQFHPVKSFVQEFSRGIQK